MTTLARLLLALLVAGQLTFSIQAQTPDPTLALSLSRDMGYGGPAGRIEGLFSFRVSGPEDLVEVRFFIDDQLVGVDTEPPWRLQFRTGGFDLGRRELYAVGVTASGQELPSNVLVREFVPASEGWGTALRIGGPLLLLALLIPIFAYLLGRRQGKRTPAYGIAGVAVCPKCGQVFGMHLWAPNVLVGKFDRCPHCRRWSVVRRASATEVALAASAAEPEDAGPQVSEEELLRRRLEASRFDEL